MYYQAAMTLDVDRLILNIKAWIAFAVYDCIYNRDGHTRVMKVVIKYAKRNVNYSTQFSIFSSSSTD